VRNLFLFVLLVNALFAAWQFFVAPADVNPYVPRNGARERELPLFTVPGQVRPRGGGSAAPNRPGEIRPGAERISGPGCFHVGPFADSAAAGAVRDRLKQTGLAVSESTGEGQEWLGHWVQIENLADEATAQAAMARLVAGGAPDATLTSQNPPFSLSLGVFKVRARADAVATTARSLGFSPTITDRYRNGPQYWVELQLAADQSLNLAGVAGETSQILRAESVTCVAPPAPTQ
jgi:hypothetical protein